MMYKCAFSHTLYKIKFCPSFDWWNQLLLHLTAMIHIVKA